MQTIIRPVSNQHVIEWISRTIDRRITCKSKIFDSNRQKPCERSVDSVYTPCPTRKANVTIRIEGG